MSKVLSIASLAVVGIIVADILTHPTGTTAASKGVNQLASTTVNGLLGK